MRVAVLGGTGFIGSHVTRWLVESGAKVTTIQRGSRPARGPGVRSLRADRRHTSELVTALADAAPAVLIDMIAYTREDMERLLPALPASLRRLVVISSGDVYWTYGAFLGHGRGSAAASPLAEDAPLRERLHPYRARAGGPEDVLYGYEKIEVERTARAGAGVPVTILRLPMVYGPGDPQNRVGGWLERLAPNGGTLRINAAEAAWRCTRAYVEDVAWAIRLAALEERGVGEIFNVGEAEVMPELEWVCAIAATAGWSGKVIGDPEAPPSLSADWSTDLIVDTHRLREVLGYREPIGREEGLRRTVACWRFRPPNTSHLNQ